MTTKRLLLVLAMSALFVALGSAAQAHDQEGVVEWLEAWESRVLENGGLEHELLEELFEFRDGHICHFETCSSPSPKPAVKSSSGYTGMGTNVEQWRGLVSAYSNWNVNVMMCIMAGESGGNPGAVNPRSGAAGLFQVMPFWWAHYGGDRFDPATNVRVANLIWQQQGYQAWSVYNRGKC